MSIGTKLFYLPSTTDLAGLRARLTMATREGGAMVDIPVEGTTLAALITPGLPVFLETREIEEPTPPAQSIAEEEWLL
ncbi:hypothetical protein E3T33_03250 [Cryobacterium sp. TMT1-2-1]|nr:hypothetical protein E3T33_03250 [Cryobacterium sp. TMT1-2-1]